MKKDNNYFEEILTDKNMSLREKGIFTFIIHYPTCTKEQIINYSKDGIYSIEKALKILKEAGYIKSIKIRNKENKIKRWAFEIHPFPKSNPNLTIISKNI
ncbi:MAG: hypothetical protein ACTSX6_08235 [Candidatus Heimdallarchaeaceae archaeon]